MATILDVASWALLSAGGLFVLIGGIGALRMPNLYTRMHAASVTDTLGAILVLAGLMLQAGLTLVTVKLAIILLFMLTTSPTASYALASAALLSGIRPDAGRAADHTHDDRKPRGDHA
jgi:multicomponent Na+:H+ antiporter subunit G